MLETDVFVAFLVGLATPRGLTLPVNEDDLMPLMVTQPKVSQYRPDKVN